MTKAKKKPVETLPTPEPPTPGDRLYTVDFDGVPATAEFVRTEVNEYGYTNWIVRSPPEKDDFVWRVSKVSPNYYHRSELDAYEEYRDGLAKGLASQRERLDEVTAKIAKAEMSLQDAEERLRVLRGEAYDPERADFVCILSDGEPYRMRVIGDKCWMLKLHPDKRWVTRSEATDEQLRSLMGFVIEEQYKPLFEYNVPFRPGGWPRPEVEPSTTEKE